MTLALRRLDRVEAARGLVRKATRALGGFAKSFKISVGGLIEASVDLNDDFAGSGDLETDLPELFLALGRAAQAANKPIVLLLDELQYLSTPDLSALIVALHRISQKNLPIVFFGGALSTNRASSIKNNLIKKEWCFPPNMAKQHLQFRYLMNLYYESWATD